VAEWDAPKLQRCSAGAAIVEHGWLPPVRPCAGGEALACWGMTATWRRWSRSARAFLMGSSDEVESRG
jgi:hypothetical protein